VVSERLIEREKRIQRKYGLTPEQWAELMRAQHNRCAGCLKGFSRARLPCVDHDHESGLVRGLQCTACNYEIGLRHDDAEWFLRIGNYLQHPPALNVLGAVYVPGSAGAARSNGE
jgi:hypothetical protein